MKEQTLDASKNFKKKRRPKVSQHHRDHPKNQSQLSKSWDDKKIPIFKRQLDQQNVFSNGFFAQNALNDSCLWMNCQFLATFGYGYVYNLISKTLSSYNDKKKKGKKPQNTHANTFLQRREISVQSRKERFTWIYLLLDHLIRKM